MQGMETIINSIEKNISENLSHFVAFSVVSLAVCVVILFIISTVVIILLSEVFSKNKTLLNMIAQEQKKTEKRFVDVNTDFSDKIRKTENSLFDLNEYANKQLEESQNSIKELEKLATSIVDKARNLGEECVSNTIEESYKNAPDYYLVNDIYMYNNQKKHYHHTQIDHVLVKSGYIFAIETKYWLGDTYIFKNKGVSDNDTNAIYDNHIIVNMKGTKVNTYSDCNVITQTVRNATKLQDKLNSDLKCVKYVYGILVFVDNDKCKIHFEEKEVGVAKVTPLSRLVDCIDKIIQEKEPAYDISKYDEVKTKLYSLKRNSE